MNLKKIRTQSLVKAKKLGYETNPNLPLLEEDLNLRPVAEIIDRSLALLAVVAGSYGFDKSSAISWIEREGGKSKLAGSEISFLTTNDGDVSYVQTQVEALNAYAWSLEIVKKQNLGQALLNL